MNRIYDLDSALRTNSGNLELRIRQQGNAYKEFQHAGRKEATYARHCLYEGLNLPSRPRGNQLLGVPESLARAFPGGDLMG